MAYSMAAQTPAVDSPWVWPDHSHAVDGTGLLVAKLRRLRMVFAVGLVPVCLLEGPNDGTFVSNCEG